MKTGEKKFDEFEELVLELDMARIIFAEEEEEEEARIVVSMKDITERKRAEERLEQVNRCLLSLGPDFNANINRITTLCGELLGGTCALYNRLEGGMISALGQWHTPQDFQPKDIPEGHICYDVIGGIAGDLLFVQDLLHTRYAVTDINVRRYGLQSYLGHAVRCGSKAVGSLCVVFRNPYKPTENDKRLLGILASALSTEENRHEAEKKVAMLSDAIETAHHGCLIISEDYKVVIGNNYALTKLGFESDELKNLDLFSLCADREQVNDIIETMKVTKRWMGEIVVTKKDGKQFPALVSVTALGADDDPSGKRGNIILFQDITIQKEMREKLLTSEKLAVMGRLTADVAHELNNPLAIVIGGTQLVLSRIDEKAQTTFKSQLETVLRNARRCKTILNNLLGYGRTIGKKEEAVNLPDLIREAIDDVNYQYDMSAIETVLNYLGSAGASSEQAVAEITGNKSALLSVLVNLIRNARQAMGEKGRLTITIEKEDKKHLRIEIHDTGSGISKEQKVKLFQPFASGWKEREGSGLGLATSLGIIETHGGSMSAESEGEGKGATFTILLPCEFKGKK